MKSFAMPGIIYNGQSPSTRREWIEIKNYTLPADGGVMSPSTRREWIEIAESTLTPLALRSPSTRREWIEILIAILAKLQ